MARIWISLGRDVFSVSASKNNKISAIDDNEKNNITMKQLLSQATESRVNIVDNALHNSWAASNLAIKRLHLPNIPIINTNNFHGEMVPH